MERKEMAVSSHYLLIAKQFVAANLPNIVQPNLAILV
jgi:hypothetical protein